MDGLGTARRRLPPPPLSSPLSPWRPGTQTHQLRGAPSKRVTAGGHLPREGTPVPSWALRRQRQRRTPERPRRRAKFAERGLSGHPPPRAPGLRVPPSSPWSPRHRPPQGAPQAAQDVDGGGEDRSPARPQIPRVSCPSCPPAVRTRRARRSPASSWIGSWEPRRPLLSPGAEEAERRAERRFCFAFLKLRLPSSRPGRAALPFPGRPGPRPGSTARRAQRPAPRSGPWGGSAGAARTLRG